MLSGSRRASFKVADFLERAGRGSPVAGNPGARGLSALVERLRSGFRQVCRQLKTPSPDPCGYGAEAGAGRLRQISQ